MQIIIPKAEVLDEIEDYDHVFSIKTHEKGRSINKALISKYKYQVHNGDLDDILIFKKDIFSYFEEVLAKDSVKFIEKTFKSPTELFAIAHGLGRRVEKEIDRVFHAYEAEAEEEKLKKEAQEVWLQAFKDNPQKIAEFVKLAQDLKSGADN